MQPFFIAGTLYSQDHEPNGNGLTYIMCHFHQFGGSSGSSCQDARTGFLQNGCCRACSCRALVAIFSEKNRMPVFCTQQCSCFHLEILAALGFPCLLLQTSLFFSSFFFLVDRPATSAVVSCSLVFICFLCSSGSTAVTH